MKKSDHFRRASCIMLALSMAGWIALSTPLSARVGERQGQIEDRLLADGTAQRLQPLEALGFEVALRGMVPGRTMNSGRGSGRNLAFIRGAATDTLAPSVSGFDIGVIDNLLWQAIGQTAPAPDANGIKKRPPDFPEYIYFKTDDGTPAAQKLQQTTNLTGWELRVYLYKQLSGLEIYHRVGAPLLDSEIAALLNANRGEGNWVRGGAGSASELPGGDNASASFIGFEYERSDGQVRAHVVGSDLVIFSTELDRNLLKVSAAINKANADKGVITPAASSTRGF